MSVLRIVGAVLFSLWIVAGAAMAVPLPGGTLDPLTIPKYVTPLVIPPVMKNNGAANDYDIAVRQFKQQILPGGIWNTLNGRADAFPATTVWSYGPEADRVPDSTALGGGVGIAPAPNSQFNYPAYTIETHFGNAGQCPMDQRSGGPGDRQLPAAPAADRPDAALGEPPATGCMMGLPDRTDCATDNAGALHRPGADRHPCPRRPRRSRQRRLPGGLVAAGREQHPGGLRHDGILLRRRNGRQPGKSRVRRLQLPQRPAGDHPLVPRPLPWA